jgi:hypothetical protein
MGMLDFCSVGDMLGLPLDRRVIVFVGEKPYVHPATVKDY